MPIMKPQDSLSNTAVRRRSARLQAQQLQSIETPRIETPRTEPSLIDPHFTEPSLIKPHSIPALRKFCPKRVDNLVTKWVESIPGPEFHSDPILKRRTKSAPNMGYTQDMDGLIIPPVLTSTAGRSHTQSFASLATTSSIEISDRSSGRSLVRDPNYRSMNLAANNIYLRPLHKQFPDHIASLLRQIGRNRCSTGPSLDQVKEDARLNELWMGSTESKVEKYFQSNIFPDPEPSDSLKRTDRLPIAKRAVPVGSNLNVSGPIPDMLYGYDRHGAFPQQQAQLISMGTEMVANSQDLIYPFFVIEFKGDGPSGDGSLWTATNQCLGGSISCVNITERLNHHLRECKSENVQSIDNTVFSVAMNGTEARLYISWKHDELNYYMQSVENFLLQDPEHYLKFRKSVLNIIDYGKDRRLKQIRESLDNLLEEKRKRTSEIARSRPPPSPPSDDSISSSGYKLRALCKRKKSNHNQVSDAIQDIQVSYSSNQE